MKKVLLFLMTLLPLFVSGQVKRTIHVATAGTLPTLISEEEKYEIEELTLSGELNGTDFKFIRDMAGVIDKVCKENYGEVEYWAEHIQTKGVLKSLDLAESRILNGGEVYGIEGGPTATCLPPEGYQTVLDCISSYLFARTKLETIILPNSITSLGECVFYNCNRLTSITIPNSVTSIGDNTFYGCDGLKSVTSLNPVPPSITGTSLGSVYENAVLNVPQGSKEAYMNADFWKLFKTINAVGDINGDGIIDSADIKEIEKYIMGNPSPYFDVKKADINNDGVVNVADMVIIINRIKNNSDEDDKSGNYLTFVAEETCGFHFTGTTGNNRLYWSIDGGTTWFEQGSDNPDIGLYPTPISLSAGQKIMWKGNLTPSTTYPNFGICTFSSSGRFSVEGNVMSLLYGDVFADKTDLTGKDYAFYELFSGCTGLTSAERLCLPATTLAVGCYDSMFRGCTSLTTAPELPATTLAESCYQYMFIDCTSLTTAPSLPATTLTNSCYRYMFHSCTSLTVAPSLPALNLASNCYCQMFQNCTRLTTAPELSATTLADWCYSGMFNGCTSLTTVPSILPATTLASFCYYGMFSLCTSLTTAPELPATTLAYYCYVSMFADCTSLTTAPELPATRLVEGCYSQMFVDCPSLTTAPELPATTLARYCYRYMFGLCKSLTAAPELLATTLVNGCYNSMFNGCTSLKYIKCLATNISATDCTTYWVSGVSSSGTFVKASSMTSWTAGNDGIPSGWTVCDEK